MGEEGREGRREICIYSKTKIRGEILTQEIGLHERPKADGTGPKGKAEARSTGGS